MANLLLQRLRKEDKKGLFNSSQTSPSYQTGFLPFDYRNGYRVNSIDIDENLIDTHTALGLVGGSFVTIIGKSGTAKTTFAIQSCANIVRPFESGMVIHFDLEQATTYTRVRNITRYNQQELTEKYVLKQDDNYIDDIFDAIVEICATKESDQKAFRYDSGLLDEFGKELRPYVPTCIIIDSIPALAAKMKGKAEMEGQTYANRNAANNSQFYKKLIPLVKKYNLIVVTINHINQKIEINPMAKSQPQVMYLKMDESLPGGNAPIYYANNLIKFVSFDKAKKEDVGYNGFKVRAEMIKSRTSKAGQCCTLIYTQDRGFDPVLTQLEYATDAELIEGRNPYRRFKGLEDIKFDGRKFTETASEKPELLEALYSSTIKIMERNLEEGFENNSLEVSAEMFDRIFDDIK